MSPIRFSKRAEQDLREILLYTVGQWGKEQAVRYMDDLDRLFALLLIQPHIGRFYSDVHPQWQRIEHASHVILYSRHQNGVTIQRIEHNRRLLDRSSR